MVLTANFFTFICNLRSLPNQDDYIVVNLSYLVLYEWHPPPSVLHSSQSITLRYLRSRARHSMKRGLKFCMVLGTRGHGIFYACCCFTPYVPCSQHRSLLCCRRRCDHRRSPFSHNLSLRKSLQCQLRWMIRTANNQTRSESRSSLLRIPT